MKFLSRAKESRRAIIRKNKECGLFYYTFKNDPNFVFDVCAGVFHFLGQLPVCWGYSRGETSFLHESTPNKRKHTLFARRGRANIQLPLLYCALQVERQQPL